MESKKTGSRLLKIIMPLVLGGGILYWMYRDFDLESVGGVMLREMDWTWMLLSFPFGILAQMLRGWRWKQTLDPMVQGHEGSEVQGYEGTAVRRSVCVNAVFLSYAASLVVPRIGEFMRCGVLRRWDGVPFAKALGTVVTERAVDMVIVMLYSGLVLLLQMSTFGSFFKRTGTTLDCVVGDFSLTGWTVTVVCGVAALLLLHLLLKRLYIYNKVKTTLNALWEGVLSLRQVSNLTLYLALSVGIWVCYFLHFYLTFFCFEATAGLGIGCALVCFVVCNFAVLVPTPNGAGPWHFAVKTMLILYGVADVQALYFVLIVHTVQTLLVMLLGVWAWLRLSFTPKKQAL